MKRRHPQNVASNNSDISSTSNDDNNMSKQHHHSTSPRARISRFVARARETTVQRVQIHVKTLFDFDNNSNNKVDEIYETPLTASTTATPIEAAHSDKFNYALLIILYTLQGIPMGLSASIPFLLQDKITQMAKAQAASVLAETVVVGATATSVLAIDAAKASYNANAIFALCSWPFSLKLLWAPVVDAVYIKRFGRRKSWLVPVQTVASLIMIGGAQFVQDQLGLSSSSSSSSSDSNNTMNIRGVTSFFFVLYFLMATQDIAVDGWALTMLSKPNRGKGPICNSIGQNIGYFLSFVGFLAMNDIEASETLWRPLLRLKSNPTQGLVSLKGFLRFMGFFMLATTFMVALFKRELPRTISSSTSSTEAPALLAQINRNDGEDNDEDAELDASEIGLKETYHRLWAVCQLPAVRMLFVILVTYRLPTALSDNVKFLKAVQLGLSKSTTALLSPTLILPLGILVPIIAHKIWHMAPLTQFLRAYQFRVTLIPLLDICMLRLLQQHGGEPGGHNLTFWLAIIASTAGQAICNSLQFNAQMTFFASRVDPAIGGSYMTLLNTAANLGGTWPASFVMMSLSALTSSSSSNSNSNGDGTTMTAPRDPYIPLQIVFSILGVLWLILLGPKLKTLAVLPDEAWRTHLLDSDTEDNSAATGGTSTATATSTMIPRAGASITDHRTNSFADIEAGDVDVAQWKSANSSKNK